MDAKSIGRRGAALGWMWCVLVAVVLLQACGQGGRTTGPSSDSSSASIALGRRVAQLPQGCTGTLIIDGPGGFHVELPIGPDGKVSIPGLTPGQYTFAVKLDCPDGPAEGSTVVNIVPGQNDVTVNITLNKPPAAGASCDVSSLQLGQSTRCHCSGTDPNGDHLTVTWNNASGLSSTSDPNPTFTPPATGKVTLTCQVSDGKAAPVSASTEVNVTQAPPPPPPATGTARFVNDDACGECSTTVEYVSGPQSFADFSFDAPPVTRTLKAGSYQIHFGAFVPESFCTGTFTVTGGQTVTVHVNRCLD